MFEIDRFQVFIYVEDAGLNVSSCLELFEGSQKSEIARLLGHFRFDMGELTRVKFGYIVRIRYDFISLKAQNIIRQITERPFLIFIENAKPGLLCSPPGLDHN